MRIVVDEMPTEPKECIFNAGGDYNQCVINNRCLCRSVSECKYLVPLSNGPVVDDLETLHCPDSEGM